MMTVKELQREFEAFEYNFMLNNIKQILKFINYTLIDMIDTKVECEVEFKLLEDDIEYTRVGIHDDGEFYIQFPYCEEYRVDVDNMDSVKKCASYTYKGKHVFRFHFDDLVYNWARIKKEFFQRVAKNISKKQREN